tara:strand:+ start:201 stop:800 length:600 start_codon:yes stop_codon:yes gene_type:complete
MDDLVPAGSTPDQWDGPMEGIHKQISFMLLMTSILFAIIVGNFSQLSYFIMIFLFVMLTIQIIVWSSFKRKSKNALMPAMLNLLFSIVLFSLVSIYFISFGITFGDILFLLIGIITLYTTTTSWRRLGILRDPVYQAWYYGYKIDVNAMSFGNEVVASCYNCESILAIEIEKFAMDLKCPTCNLNLVSNETIFELSEEE